MKDINHEQEARNIRKQYGLIPAFKYLKANLNLSMKESKKVLAASDIEGYCSRCPTVNMTGIIH